MAHNNGGQRSRGIFKVLHIVQRTRRGSIRPILPVTQCFRHHIIFPQLDDVQVDFPFLSPSSYLPRRPTG